jgi:SAM-dependent methyltransferase
MSDAPNETQRRNWNSDTRITAWLRREPLTATVTATLLPHAQLASGERVLDVGCGGGRTTIGAAGQVGAGGAAVGADISAPLAELARQRAERAGVTNARFALADMQTTRLDEAPFDAAISQFGVMFFEESVTAFANIRAHLRPGGRLAFVCWQAVSGNRWYPNSAIRPFVPPVPEPGPGKNATGPFTLADRQYTAGVLAAAGWTGIEQTPYWQTVPVEREVLEHDQAYLRFLGVPEDRLEEAHAAGERHLAALRRADGRYDAPLAFQVFTARSSGRGPEQRS